MTSAGNLDITIDQGADFVVPFQLIDEDGDPISLSLATISAKIRSIPSSTVVATFTGTVTSGPDGEGQVALTAAETAAIPVDPSTPGDRVLTEYMWDCEVTFSDGFVQRILQGYVYVSPEVTYA